MSRFLIDINVLIALFDPRHLYHEIAHRWWSDVGSKSWATTNTVENGFARIVSSPGYPSLDVMTNQAIKSLNDFIKKQKSHKFWIEDISITDSSIFNHSYITGHKQITDIYLLGLAKKNKGKLATFDKKIDYRAIVDGSEKLLELIQ